MTQYNPSIKVGPVSIPASDIVTLFKSIAELFTGKKDPDDNIVQKSVVLENEVDEKQLWKSKNVIELEHSLKDGLRVLYNYNSEALGQKTKFENYEHSIHFSRLPKGIDTTIFFLGKSALQNKSDHNLHSKNAIGFIAIFDPPIPEGQLIEYSYTQSYNAITPLWGVEPEQVHKDFRFFRETSRFIRSFKFPSDMYSDVEPECYLLNKDKSANLEGAENIGIEIEKDRDFVTWTIKMNAPKRNTVLRVRWDRPTRRCT